MTARRRPSARKRGAMGSVLRFWGCEQCGRSNEIVVALDGAVKRACADPTRLRSLNRQSPSRRSGRSAALILALVGVSLAGFARGQVITEFPIPTANSFPYGIAAGPDGNLWFTEISGLANKIGRITTAGVVTEFPIPTAGSNPQGIAAGPDGNLWFTESSANQIGRITTAGVDHRVPRPHGQQLAFPASRPARTATSGSPRTAPTRSGGSRRPASSPSSRSPRPAASLTVSRPARTATSGSPRSAARQQDRPDHDGRRRHRVPDPDGRQQPSRDRGGPGRQPLVHRIQRQQDRPDHDGRRHHRVPDPHGQQPALRHRGGPGRQPLVHRGSGNKIGRITTAGVITEFSDPDDRAAHLSASRPARTATSGSPRTSPARSGGSRRAR